MEHSSSHKYLFVASVAGLVLFGLAMLATASAVLAFNHTLDNYFYVKRQFLNGVIPGVLLFLLMSRVPYEKLRKFALPLMVSAVILTALVLVSGFGVLENGATRWLKIGSFSFQPSEILKLASVLYLAALFEPKKKNIAKEGLMPFLFISGMVASLLIAQPDMGTLGVILLTAFAVYFLAGAKPVHLLAIVLIGIVALSVFVYFKGYAWDRIEVYLNPTRDVQGAGYQVNRAQSMIRSGGVLGIGYGQSQQKSTTYLPEPMGDSIFAVAAQELGFIGVTFAVILFSVLGWQGFTIARNSRTAFGRMLAGGISVWILAQAFINISAISGILPLTGIPLPFVSYGGTSLVVLLTACGIVYSIQRQQLADNR
ncbi:MAG: putative lipid II flippase FtsW [Candidatus Azambacteria bacterium]|nr:putative lipid II flippase FtsW [Candidatus Azambacteria bacterium]